MTHTKALCLYRPKLPGQTKSWDSQAAYLDRLPNALAMGWVRACRYLIKSLYSIQKTPSLLPCGMSSARRCPGQCGHSSDQLPFQEKRPHGFRSRRSLWITGLRTKTVCLVPTPLPTLSQLALPGALNITNIQDGVSMAGAQAQALISSVVHLHVPSPAGGTHEEPVWAEYPWPMKWMDSRGDCPP